MRYDGPAVPQATHTIIERGMSPVEAVKLLLEFEQEARKKIVGEISIENNLVNGKVLLSREDAMQRLLIQAKIMINGRESIIETAIPDIAHKYDYDKARAIMGALAPKLAELIVAALEGNIVSAVIPRGL